MSDDRIGLFILLIAAWTVLGAVTENVHQMLDRFTRRNRKDRTSAEGCLLIVFTLLIFQPSAFMLGGWIDQQLWNTVAVKLGLPQIDLLTAIFLGMLFTSLIWSTNGRTVHVDRPVDIREARDQ